MWSQFDPFWLWLQVFGAFDKTHMSPTFSKFLFSSFFHSLLWSRTIADGAAAGLIVFISEASAFCFFNPEHCGIIQAVEAMFVKLQNKHGQQKKKDLFL